MKRSIFFFFIFLTIAIPLFLFAESRNVVINEIAWPVKAAYAANGPGMGTVVINEIAWMGGPVEGVEEKQWWRYEWLELYNAKESPLQLDGWTIELWRDPSADSGQAKLDFLIPLLGTIPSQGYFVVGASDRIPHVDLNYKNLGGKFFNGGQKVVLKNSLGEIIDEVDTRRLSLSVGVDATSSWPAGDNKTKQTMERVGGSDPCVSVQVQGSDPCETRWQTSKEPGGTPKASNSEGAVSEIRPLTSLSLNSDSSGNKEIEEREVREVRGGDSSAGSEFFQARVSLVHPITVLAGFLALGFSGILLLLKRSLASRQARLQERQERQKVEHLEQSRKT